MDWDLSEELFFISIVIYKDILRFLLSMLSIDWDETTTSKSYYPYEFWIEQIFYFAEYICWAIDKFLGSLDFNSSEFSTPNEALLNSFFVLPFV